MLCTLSRHRRIGSYAAVITVKQLALQIQHRGNNETHMLEVSVQMYNHRWKRVDMRHKVTLLLAAAMYTITLHVHGLMSP